MTVPMPMPMIMPMPRMLSLLSGTESVCCVWSYHIVVSYLVVLLLSVTVSVVVVLGTESVCCVLLYRIVVSYRIVV